MDIMELGAIGELVGGVAVVASLLFVGLQIRQNASSVRYAAQDYTNDAAVGFLRSLYQDPEVCQMFWKGVMEPGRYEQEELLRFRTIAVALWLHLEVYFHQWKRGELDAVTWEPLRVRILWFFTRPGMREAWEVGLPSSADFARFLESESLNFDPRPYDALLQPSPERA